MSLGILRGVMMAAGAAYLAGRWVKRSLGPGSGPPPEVGAGRYDDVLVKDPVCGAYIPSRQAVIEIVGGEKRFFCSKECRGKFLTETGRVRR